MYKKRGYVSWDIDGERIKRYDGKKNERVLRLEKSRYAAEEPWYGGKRMRTYLVTGGAGFIGSNYIHYVLKKYGDEIRIINVDALT